MGVGGCRCHCAPKAKIHSLVLRRDCAFCQRLWISFLELKACEEEKPKVIPALSEVERARANGLHGSKKLRAYLRDSYLRDSLWIEERQSLKPDSRIYLSVNCESSTLWVWELDSHREAGNTYERKLRWTYGPAVSGKRPQGRFSAFKMRITFQCSTGNLTLARPC